MFSSMESSRQEEEALMRHLYSLAMVIIRISIHWMCQTLRRSWSWNHHEHVSPQTPGWRQQPSLRCYEQSPAWWRCRPAPSGHEPVRRDLPETHLRGDTIAPVTSLTHQTGWRKWFVEYLNEIIIVIKTFWVVNHNFLQDLVSKNTELK